MRVVLKSVAEDGEDVEDVDRIGHPMIVAGRRAVSHCRAGVPGFSHVRACHRDTRVAGPCVLSVVESLGGSSSLSREGGQADG
jgi:hypothetical protein